MSRSNRGLIKVVHPENFSSDPVTLGQAFYDVEQGPDFDMMNPRDSYEKCHFVIAHTHRFQRGKSKDGIYEIIALPCTRDPQRTQYSAKVRTSIGNGQRVVVIDTWNYLT
jgi:hypothetical protein